MQLRNKLKAQQGVTLLLAIMVLSAILAISLSVATILLTEARNSGDLVRTETSYYAAQASVEQGLFKIKRSVATSSCDSVSLPNCYSSQVGIVGVSNTENSVSDPVQQDQIPAGTGLVDANTFSAKAKHYSFYNPSDQTGGSGYGSVRITYLPTGNDSSVSLHVYLCQFDPSYGVSDSGASHTYLTAPCSDPSSNEYWLLAAKDLTVSPGNSITLDSNYGFLSSKQQELILFNPSSAGTIYVKIETFNAAGNPIGIPYFEQTAVDISSQSQGISRKVRVIIPNGAGFSSAVTAPTLPPVTTTAFGTGSLVLGASTSLTYTITNPNPSATLSGVGFSNALPVGLVVDASGVSGSCGGGAITATAGGGNISLSGASLSSSASCTFSVNVRSINTGSVTNNTGNVASVEAGNGDPALANLIITAPACTSLTYRAATSGFSTTNGGPSNPSTLSVPSGQTPFYIYVDYGMTGIDAINAPSATGATACTYQAFMGTVARFSCVTPAIGTYSYSTGLTNYPAGSNICASGPQNVGTVTVGPAQSNPTNLTLTQPQGANNKSFSVSWTGGMGNGGVGGCKLQYHQQNGNHWTDITSASSVNCDTAASNVSYQLNDDGWKANWGGTDVRLVRKSDSAVMGTFPQTLACSYLDPSDSPTPTIDEDCNGRWDNTSGGGCNNFANGCDAGWVCEDIAQYSDSSCSSYSGYTQVSCGGSYMPPGCVTTSQPNIYIIYSEDPNPICHGYSGGCCHTECYPTYYY